MWQAVVRARPQSRLPNHDRKQATASPLENTSPANALPEDFMSTDETIRPKRKLLLSKEAVRRLESAPDSSAVPADASPQQSDDSKGPGCSQQNPPPKPPPKPRP
jgi:hypothetical protein